jgi:hypothetical protein
MDIDAHGQEVAAVADVARRAADDIDRVQASLRQLKVDAEATGLEVDPGSDRIVPMPHSTHGRREMQAAIPGLQARLDAIIADANAVDGELAMAINMADADVAIPLPPGPNDGSKPMTNAQVTDAVNDMLDGQDLSPAERERLSQQLTNSLRSAAANGIPADQALAAAEDQAGAFMTNLHRSYVRIPTRLQTWRDAARTPEGDLLSKVSGDVIPARRNSNGDLIWFDKDTGKEVGTGPVGPEDSMTLPERGSSHLGHQSGEENWRVLKQAEEEGWTQKELNDFMNQKDRYRLETPEENSGHANEDKGEYAPNPDWTPERVKGGMPAPGPLVGAPPSPATDGQYHEPSTGPLIQLPPMLDPSQLAPIAGAGGGLIGLLGLAALIA